MSGTFTTVDLDAVLDEFESNQGEDDKSNSNQVSSKDSIITDLIPSLTLQESSESFESKNNHSLVYKLPEISDEELNRIVLEEEEEVNAGSPPPYSEVDPMNEENEKIEIAEENRPIENVEENSSDIIRNIYLENNCEPDKNLAIHYEQSPVPQLLQGLTEEQLILGKVSPWWVPDTEASACMICDLKFTITKRRHHCRSCGKVLCLGCSSEKFHLPYLDFRESRVCKPCLSILQRLKKVDSLPSSLRRPNPANPMEYCSTIPPYQQVQSISGSPPSVLVPIGVLKHSSESSKSEGKKVTFSDGITPGSDVLESHRGNFSRSRSRISLMTEKSLLPYTGLPEIFGVGRGNKIEIEASLRSGSSLPFSLNKKLIVYVQLVFYTPANSLVWNYRTQGLCSLAQDELVFLLMANEDEALPPRDVFDIIQEIYENIKNKGIIVSHMGFTTISNDKAFLGTFDFGGVLYFRHSFQCIKGLDLPSQPPFLFGVFITRWEIPWAKIFPLRLLLRLGAYTRYYPAPLWSSRTRSTVYKEIGNTVMKLLCDFHNFKYSLPIIPGLVIQMENRLTTVFLPKNRYSEIQRALTNSSDPVLALGANFHGKADSHLVAIQKTEEEQISNPGSSDYETHAINILNSERKITGACFIVFNGALKSSSGLTAKSSIVEDGIMVQVSSERMSEIRKTLMSMGDIEIGCGPLHSAEQPEETVAIKWIQEDNYINIGIKSNIDHKPLDGIVSNRILKGMEYHGKRHFIRWTEIFFISNYQVEKSKVIHLCAKAVCRALLSHLKLLVSTHCFQIGVRVSLNSDNVSFDAGSNGSPLNFEVMTSLDNELIPIIHHKSMAHETIFELVFHILDT